MDLAKFEPMNVGLGCGGGVGGAGTAETGGVPGGAISLKLRARVPKSWWLKVRRNQEC